MPKRYTIDDWFAKTAPEPNSGCWLWLGHVNKTGYPIAGGKLAHRLIYQRTKGVSLTSKQHVRHKCDVPSCINPEHLCVGSHQDSMADMVRKDRVGADKLTRAQVRSIRERLSAGEKDHDIARDFPVKAQAIFRIRTGHTWSGRI